MEHEAPDVDVESQSSPWPAPSMQVIPPRAVLPDTDDDLAAEGPALSGDVLATAFLALRRALPFLAACVFGMALLERIRPLEATNRDVFSTPFRWAIVLWLVVFLFDAFRFAKSRLGNMQREPLLFAAATGVFTFAVGLAQFSPGNSATDERISYVIVQAVGVAFVWWAIFSLIALVIAATRRHD